MGLTSHLTVPATCTFLGTIATPIFDNLFAEGDPNLRWNVAGLLSLFERKVRIGFGYRDAIHSTHLEGRAEFYNVANNPVTGQPILPRATATARPRK